MDEHRIIDVEPATARRRSRRRSLRGRLVVGLVLVAALAGVGIYLRTHGGGPPASQTKPAAPRGRFAAQGPMPVVAAAAQAGDMPVGLSGLGTVTPLNTVTVRTQIAGQLVQIAFREGQEVEKGDFLALVDPRPYQLAVDQSEGQLARDQALLKNAQLDLTRYRTLVAQDSLAKQQLDTQAALVGQYTATVRTDQAQLGTARLNLAYCRILSPIAGRVGLRQVDQGNYVTVNDANGIVVVTQLKPISVVFTLPEDNVPAIMQRLRAGAKLPATAYDRSDTTKLAEGMLETVDNQIDVNTGTVKLKAQFANDDEGLFPNQFVNIHLLVDTLRGAVIVPTSAVQRGAPGTFVYVIKADDTVTVRPVKLGPGDGTRVAVTEGLAPGERVVVDGADKLKDGAAVTVPDAAAAAAAPAPAPPGQPKPRRRPAP